MIQIINYLIKIINSPFLKKIKNNKIKQKIHLSNLIMDFNNQKLNVLITGKFFVKLNKNFIGKIKIFLILEIDRINIAI